MTLKNLECVVLKRDVPESGLRKGDVGTVVETYPNGGLEVEFVTATGSTVAVVTLNEGDVRAATSTDVLAARSSA